MYCGIPFPHFLQYLPILILIEIQIAKVAKKQRPQIGVNFPKNGTTPSNIASSNTKPIVPPKNSQAHILLRFLINPARMESSFFLFFCHFITPF